jgi:hypothetical protein
MARLIWFVFMLALAALLVAGVSWVAAYTSLNNLLGAPPPQMGVQTTTFVWDGLPRLRDRPRVWSFAFQPTSIPGAEKVRIYISPFGKVVLTEPSDLAARLSAFHNTGY